MSAAVISEYVIKPLLVGLFTTTGAGVPIAILLWRYSKSEKRRLDKTLPFLEDEIKTWESMERVNMDTTQRYHERIRDDIDALILPEGKLEQYQAIISKAEDSLRIISNKIAELRRRRQYIVEYNFWSVIENFIERRYVSVDTSGR